jgi:DUF1680 family protein
MRKVFCSLLISSMLGVQSFGITVESGSAKMAAQVKVPVKAYAFNLKDVRLLDGPFEHAMQKDVEWLTALEPDRFLSWFRKNAGLEPKAEVYGGWESQSIAGHSLGHYLSACAMGYAATSDTRLLQKVNYIVDELALCQETESDGYTAAIPDGRKVFAEVARGEIRSKGFDLNGCWVPWYTTHKVMAGLRDAYLFCDNEKAKEVLVKMADWAYETTDKLSDEKIQLMLACEHGGMNEAAADVYSITADKKYLTLAERFNHKFVLDPLSKQQDKLAGLHCNTQVPKLIGCARQYEMTGDEYFKRAAHFFWETVVDNHSYVIGGNSNGEYLGEPGKLSNRLSDNTAETCNTYNMLRLTKHLLTWEPKAKYGDFYERALFNHILASQDPASGMVCYYVPLRQGAKKTYSTPDDSFWCCVGTGMENHVKYAESVYFHKDNDLYVNLFIASQLNWREKGLVLRLDTGFPHEETIRLSFQCERPTEFTVHIRKPYWAKQGMRIKYNTVEQELKVAEDGFVALKKTWKDGDRLEINIPMSLRIETMPDNHNRIALLYGPLVLAGEFGLEVPQPWVPVLVTDGRDVKQWVKPARMEMLRFKTVGVGRPSDFTMIPFYRMHHQHYSVYFDLFTEQDWQKRQADYDQEQKRLKELEERTVDVMAIGEMQPERNHNLQGEKTSAGEHMGRKWRHAVDGGYFAFDMKVLTGQKMELICTYWGGDSGGREFDILIDDETITTQVLNNNKPGEFFDAVYSIPKELTKGKEKVRIKFAAHQGRMAGGLFGCRMVKCE